MTIAAFITRKKKKHKAAIKVAADGGVRKGLMLTDYMKLAMNNLMKKYWKILKFPSKMNGPSKNHYIDFGI